MSSRRAGRRCLSLEEAHRSLVLCPIPLCDLQCFLVSVLHTRRAGIGACQACFCHHRVGLRVSQLVLQLLHCGLQPGQLFQPHCRMLQPLFLGLQTQLKLLNAGFQPRNVGLVPMYLQVLLRWAALVGTIVLFAAKQAATVLEHHETTTAYPEQHFVTNGTAWFH